MKASQDKVRHLSGINNCTFKWEVGCVPSIFALYSSKAILCYVLSFNVLVSLPFNQFLIVLLFTKNIFDHRITNIDFHNMFLFVLQSYSFAYCLKQNPLLNFRAFQLNKYHKCVCLQRKYFIYSKYIQRIFPKYIRILGRKLFSKYQSQFLQSHNYTKREDVADIGCGYFPLMSAFESEHLCVRDRSICSVE